MNKRGTGEGEEEGEGEMEAMVGELSVEEQYNLKEYSSSDSDDEGQCVL